MVLAVSDVTREEDPGEVRASTSEKSILPAEILHSVVSQSNAMVAI